MKKIFLLALMLGLTGCGENGQNDNSQAISTNQNLTIHAQPYSAATAPLLGGWSVTSTSAEGASTLLQAAKDTRVSAALITPNAAEVAKVLRGGAAGIALSLAIDQILGAVDWVLDPANNQVKYRPDPNDIDPDYVWFYRGVAYETMQASCNAAYATLFDGNSIQTSCYENNRGRAIVCGRYTPDYGTCFEAGTKTQREEPVEKSLSLDIVAQQVISNAQDEDLDAQVATNAAAQAILTEAYDDEAKAQPIVDKLENNAKDNCPGGVNSNGSCWICDSALKYPYVRATRDARIASRGKSCNETMDESTKAANAALWVNLITARLRENACWLPSDIGHQTALVENYKALQKCTE